MTEMVEVDLDGSYGYEMPGGGKKYFGPGKQILVPYGLALTLGLVKAEAEAEIKAEAETEVEPEDFVAPSLYVQELLGQAEAEETRTEETTPLPDDFPGRVALVKAGYETVDSLVDLTFDELVAIKGIGQQTARLILERLEEM
jgi:hypothetical protein